MCKDLVSIVMAAYNAEEHIKECIESIINQTYTNWELIICDDNSNDGTVDIVKEFQKDEQRIRLIQNKENMRAGASRNNCIQISRGNLIMIQDADDVCTEDRIEKLVNRINKGDVDFVSSGHYLFDDEGKYKTVVMQIEFPQKKIFFSVCRFVMRPHCLKRTVYQW